MPTTAPRIYLSTILLERNRWKSGREPSFLVSEQMSRAAQAGFDGLEVFANHLLKASRGEWDRIKELGNELQVHVEVINSYVPTDGSEESMAARAAINDACSFFQPSGLKMNIGGKSVLKAEESEIREALEFVKKWSTELPSHTLMLMENHGNTFMEREEDAEKARAYLGEDKFKTIIHPFNMDHDHLRKLMAKWKDSIVHLHVQFSSDSGRICLEENPKFSAETIRIVRESGFQGTWALEFTGGTGKPQETMDLMWDNAVRDLEFIRTAHEKVL